MKFPCIELMSNDAKDDDYQTLYQMYYHEKKLDYSNKIGNIKTSKQ